MSGEYRGKVVVITGAGSGIGRATALRFARDKAKVHLCDVSAAALDKVRSEVEGLGAPVETHVVDVSDPAAVRRLAESVFEIDAGVDVLHNNAGVGVSGPVDRLTVEDWQRVIGINLLGVAYGVHYFVPRMLSQGRPAHIVNTASSAGLIPLPTMVPYTASKFGVVGLSLALDAELRPRGIRVTALCPGVINTPIATTTPQRGELDPAKGAKLFQMIGASPDKVADAVVRSLTSTSTIVTVPKLHVEPLWLVHRISPTAYRGVSKLLQKFTG